MSFTENLELILSQGIPTKVVLQAIHDGLLYLEDSAGDNNMRIEELKQLMLLIREDAESVNPSGAEVTEAAGEYASLLLRIDALFANQTRIEAKIEATLPVRVLRTRTEAIPIVTTYEYDATLTPSQGYIKQAGRAGVRTVSWEEEQVSGIPTGRIFNEQVAITTTMQNRIEVKGTLVVSTRPIRYIRVRSKQPGVNVAHLNEIEVYVKDVNIARNAIVTGSSTVSNPGYAIDGVRNLLSASATSTNPYIQIDLRAGHHDLTRIFVLLTKSVTYDYLEISTSTDGNLWTNIISGTGYKETGAGVDLPINLVYGSIGSYEDKSTLVDIGQNYTIVKSPIILYYSSDRALAKNTLQANLAYTDKGTHRVLNRRTVNGVTVYGLAIGWIRAEDNVG